MGYSYRRGLKKKDIDTKNGVDTTIKSILIYLLHFMFVYLT